MLIASLPLIAVVVGLLMFSLCSGKLSEVGKLTFFAGILALLLASASKTLLLLHS